MKSKLLSILRKEADERFKVEGLNVLCLKGEEWVSVDWHLLFSIPSIGYFRPYDPFMFCGNPIRKDLEVLLFLCKRWYIHDRLNELWRTYGANREHYCGESYRLRQTY